MSTKSNIAIIAIAMITVAILALTTIAHDHITTKKIVAWVDSQTMVVFQAGIEQGLLDCSES